MLSPLIPAILSMGSSALAWWSIRFGPSVDGALWIHATKDAINVSRLPASQALPRVADKWSLLGNALVYIGGTGSGWG